MVQQRLASQLRHVTRQYQQALKEKVAVDRLVEAAVDALQAAEPVRPLAITRSVESKSPHQVVALLSDVHVGEVVSASETNNLGEYNMEIFHRRLNLWTAKVLELVELRRQRLHVPRLSLFMLGDMVSGDIHDELTQTNDATVMEQVVQATQALSRAILTLSPHFETIEVAGVVGNHGRMARKPYYKKEADVELGLPDLPDDCPAVDESDQRELPPAGVVLDHSGRAGDSVPAHSRRRQPVVERRSLVWAGAHVPQAPGPHWADGGL